MGEGSPFEQSEAFFPSRDGTRLFAAALVPSEPKAAVAIVHGYADHGGRYRPLMTALAEAGFAAHALDYRGHGQAGGRRAHVGRFGDYHGDLDAFLDRVRSAHPDVPLILFAHSHGCLISLDALTGDAPPQGLRAAVLSAPYLQLRIEPTRFQLFQANVVGKLVPFMPIKNPLTSDQLTRDEALQREADTDPLKHKLVTPRWFTESNAAQERVRGRAAKLSLPFLMIQGTDDPVVVPDASRAFFDGASSTDKTYVPMEGMRHECLNEIGREAVVERIVAWIAEHVK